MPASEISLAENPVQEAAGRTSEFDVTLIIVATNVRVDLKSFVEMIDEFRRVFHASNLRSEIIVVDDAIGGAFYETLLLLNREIPHFKVIRFRRTFGESVALRIAVERARAEIILTNTWYLQIRPDASVDVIRKLREGADFISANRHPRVDSILARIQSFAFNRLTTFLTGVRLNDLNCSFRGFKKSVIDSIHFHGDLFRFVPILAIGQGFRVEEMNVVHIAEKGPSTFLNFSLYLRRLLDIFSLFFLLKFIKKPLRFFGLTGFSIFVVGAIISTRIAFDKFVKGVGALDRPDTVIGLFLMTLGPILLSIGLIGEIIIFTQGRQLADHHIDTILSGRDPKESEDKG